MYCLRYLQLLHPRRAGVRLRGHSGSYLPVVHGAAYDGHGHEHPNIGLSLLRWTRRLQHCNHVSARFPLGLDTCTRVTSSLAR